VREAAVVARGEGAEGRLVAYVAGDEAEDAELRAHLRERLPEYMVPGVMVRMEALPRTPNGKIDRRALPEAGAPARGYEAPRTVEEEALAAIWAEVLGVERVGVHDDFFALGGNSLRAVQVVARIREALGVELPVRALFQSPVLADAAVALLQAQVEEVGDEELAGLLSEIVSAPAELDAKPSTL
jgi:acyl carrier protein